MSQTLPVNFVRQFSIAVLCIFGFVADTCVSPKYLKQRFVDDPQSYFYVLAAHYQLDDISYYADNPEVLRLFLKSGKHDAALLLGEYYAKLKRADLAERYYQIALNRDVPNTTIFYAHFLANQEAWSALVKLSENSIEQQVKDYNSLAKMQIGRPIHDDFSWQQQTFLPQCKSRLLLIATSHKAKSHLERLASQLNDQLVPLGICLSEPNYLPQTLIKCSNYMGENIQCEFALADLPQPQIGYHGLVVATEHGQANVSSGIAKISLRHDANVLLHEIMHLYGFVDEYRVSQQLQESICVADTHSANIQFVATEHVESFVHSNSGVQLTQVDTCHGTNVTAVRRGSETTIMELQEVGLNQEYSSLLQLSIKAQVNNPHFAEYFYRLSNNATWLHYAVDMQNKSATSYYVNQLIERKRYREALVKLEQIKPWPLAHSQQARVYLLLDELEQARAAIDLAMAEHDSFAYVYMADLICKLDTCDTKHYVALLEQAERLNNPLARYRLAKLRQKSL